MTDVRRTTSRAASAELLRRTGFNITDESEKAMTDHIVSAFDADLKELGDKLAEMGGLCEKLVAESVDALLRRDISLARRVIDWDLSIAQILVCLGTCFALDLGLTFWDRSEIAWPASALLTGPAKGRPRNRR